MNAFLTFIQGDPAVVVLPTLGLAVSLAMVRLKRRYVRGDAKADRDASQDWISFAGRREATVSRNGPAVDEIADELVAVLSELHGLRDTLRSLSDTTVPPATIFLTLRRRVDLVDRKWNAAMRSVIRADAPAWWDAAQAAYTEVQEAVLLVLDEVAARYDERIDVDVSVAVQAIGTLEAHIKSVVFWR
ncbi:hypothetical protein [Paraburkholderia sp. J8-2]|uniref:hypothetical protein n=1 Tax=Paraburkholderia sp. J8-2 TaxID=2805440 RepID=UPI002AB6E189|nr:hypothetical protein [Paraburkholderia sp. J8-2]